MTDSCVLILSVVWKVELMLMMVGCMEHVRETERACWRVPRECDTYTHTHTHTHTHSHTHRDTYTHTEIHTHRDTYTDTQTHRHTDTQTHTHTHTHTHTLFCPFSPVRVQPPSYLNSLFICDSLKIPIAFTSAHH